MCNSLSQKGKKPLFSLLLLVTLSSLLRKKILLLTYITYKFILIDKKPQ